MGSGISIVALTEADGPAARTTSNGSIVATAIAPSDRAHEVAGRLSTEHRGVETHVMPLPSPDIVSTLLRRDLERVRAALLAPMGTRERAITEAMEALPRARRLAALLESLVPLLSAAAAGGNEEPKLKKAPKVLVDQLPSRKWTESDSTRKGKVECYICLEEYCVGDELRKLPCNHEFHSACVDKWLTSVHRTCPCCRKSVVQETDQEEEEHEDSGASAYDIIRPSAALNAAQAQLQVGYATSQRALSRSLSELRSLRNRQEQLAHERDRLQAIHRGLCDTRSQLHAELEELRGTVERDDLAPASVGPSLPSVSRNHDSFGSFSIGRQRRDSSDDESRAGAGRPFIAPTISSTSPMGLNDSDETPVPRFSTYSHLTESARQARRAAMRAPLAAYGQEGRLSNRDDSDSSEDEEESSVDHQWRRARLHRTSFPGSFPAATNSSSSEGRIHGAGSRLHSFGTPGRSSYPTSETRTHSGANPVTAEPQVATASAEAESTSPAQNLERISASRLNRARSEAQPGSPARLLAVSRSARENTAKGPQERAAQMTSTRSTGAGAAAETKTDSFTLARQNSVPRRLRTPGTSGSSIPRAASFTASSSNAELRDRLRDRPVGRSFVGGSWRYARLRAQGS